VALDWKLTVWPATGGASREILRDVSFVLGGNGRGLRLQVTPEGECREAVFSAKGAGIQLAPLSAVQVSYLHLGIWTPIFFGEVRRGGNARDVYGEDYALRGMSRRLEEVTLSPGFSAPEQAAHLTVRAIIQDVIASGQLGSPALVQYVESLCPDLGFNCRKIVDAAQQNPAALLKQISEDGAKYGVIVRWGIDPQRRFFCRPAKSDTRDVTTEAPVIQWAPPVAETPCTAVLWYVGKDSDGNWITHKSVSADAALYGERVKSLSLDAGVYPWRTVPHGLLTSSNMRLLSNAEMQMLETRGNTLPVTVISGTPPPTGGGAAPIPYNWYTLTGAAQRYILRAYWPAGGGGLTFRNPALPEGENMIAYVASTGDGRGVLRYGGALASLAGSAQGINGVFYVNLPAGTRVEIKADYTEGEYTQVIPESVDAELLDGLATFHYSSPAMEPADIQTVLFVPPVELPGRVRVTPAVGGVYEHPLEAVEYRITSNGMQMGWLTGQADDPNALAQASLIKRRDGEAVITSITAQK